MRIRLHSLFFLGKSLIGPGAISMLFAMLFVTGSLKAQSCDPVIQGLDYVCVGDATIYSDVGTSPAIPITTKLWTLSGGGVINGSNSSAQVNVVWGSTPGVYQLILTDSISGVCMASDTIFVTVANDAAPQMTCNDTVQLSLNQFCEAEVNADVILEGNIMSNDAFEIELRDESGSLIPGNLVNSSHVGQYLQAKIIHICSGNSCWGVIYVEDKLPPMLDCSTYELDCDDETHPSISGPVGFPIMTSFTILDSLSPNEYIIDGVDACGTITLEFNDRVVNNTCPPAQQYIQVIYRDWIATDEYGSSGTCTDTLYIRTGSLDSVIPPPNYDDIDLPSLNCADNFKVDSSGNPHPDVTGYPGGDALCPNIDYDYYDYRIGVCDGSYKIVREWVIADWCEGRSIIVDQVIKVLDQEVIVLCPPFKTISTNPFSCFGETNLDEPIVFDDCSAWDYKVLVKKFEPNTPPSSIDATDDNVYRNPDGSYRVENLPTGLNWIIYQVTDDCGNEQECATEILVEEKSKPIPVCDQHTVITLSNNGTAKLYAESIDDGSFDNCGIGHFEIRRMDEGNCQPGVYDSTEFRAYAEFCCADIADNPIMVVLRVYDRSNNFNDCMTFVEVQDENPPTVTCLPNIIASCENDLSDLSIFGKYVGSEAERENIIVDGKIVGRDGLAMDECGVQIDTTINYNITGCGTGTITRRFEFTDGFHQPVVCRQIITIRNLNPFPGDSIIWPNDISYTGCINNLDPSETGRPEWNSSNYCSDLKSTYSDQVFNIVEQACYKVLRTWVVLDHCEVSGQSRRWENVQVIKVSNNQAPVFTSACDDVSFPGTGGNCSGFAELIATAEDDCTPTDDLVWSYRIDAHNDGTYDYFGSGNDASGDYPGGTHKIIFRVEDQCGNENTCSFLFTILDGKQPTPYCATGIVTVVMEMSGEVAVWASDLDAGSFDNCTLSQNLRFSFSSNVNNSSRVFRCADLDDGIEEEFEVEIWVTDEAGNQDYCTTRIIIQDNAGDACPDAQTSTSVIIAGDVYNSNDEAVENVMVKVSDESENMRKEQLTANDGHFAFNGLPMYKKYTVKAHRNDDPLNGVSTKDIVLIQRHLLGKQEFTSPYQYIAADANASQSISVRDIIELRKLILGINNTFVNNDSWRFVKANQSFSNPKHPFPFEESLSFESVDKNHMNSDLVAIKIGDVNSDAVSNQLIGTEVRSKGGVQGIQVKNGSFEQGDLVEIQLQYAGNVDLEGLQFALQFDSDALDVSKFKLIENAFKESNFGLTELAVGLIKISWNAFDNQLIKPGQELAVLRFVAKSAGSISDAVFLDKAQLQCEAYSVNGIDYDLGLSFSRENQRQNGFVLMQNMPNPFDNATTIPFNLPKSGNASLHIYDVTGAKIYSTEGYFNEGLNQITISKDQLIRNGVLYYQLNNESNTATRKMIFIE